MDIRDQILDQSAGNLYWKNTEGSYLGCNENFARILGLTSPKDIVGKTEFDLLEPEQAQLIAENDKKIIQSGERVILEEEGLDENGNKAIYLSTKSPLRNEQGDIVGLIGTSIDITQQKQAEITKAEFLENMSHDLRTPFSGLLSMTEYLKSKELDPEKQELMGYIIDSAKRLLILLNQILELSKSGEHPVKYTSWDIKEIVDDVVKIFIPEAKSKNLEILVNCPSYIIYFDKFRISRILLNLLSNALKFTIKGKINIQIEITSHLKIVVKDTGIGIPVHSYEVIFDKFHKLASSYTQQNFVGTGLGLYMVKEFAKDLSGDIFVTSQIDAGSTFTFIAQL